ncbi:MAG: tetratricopeptide repeat protein [Planctomycetota bacterium]|jgi:tetratricopeptide (TPR) repeat protein
MDLTRLLLASPLFLPVGAVMHGDLDERIASATERIARAPASAGPYIDRAELHRLHGDHDACRDDLRLASGLHPNQPRLILTTARLERDLQNPELALELIEGVLATLSIPSRNGDSHRVRLESLQLHAELLTELDQAVRAIEAWSLLCASHPQPAPDWFLQRAELQDPEQALTGLEQAIEKLGFPVVLILRASELEEQLGDPQAACARLDSLLDASPRKETWLSRQGDILQRAGNHADALKKFTSARVHLARLPARHRETFSMQRLADHLERSIAELTP